MNKVFSFVVFLMANLAIFAQDVIITTDAKKIDAKILEVSKSEIKYKESDNLDGPLFILATSDINSIIYSNGKVVLYNSTPAEQSSSSLEPANRVAPTQQDEASQPSKSSEPDNSATIFLRTGETMQVQISSMNRDGVIFVINGSSEWLAASKIEKIVFANGQIKSYVDSKETRNTNTQPQPSLTTVSNSTTQTNGGRIYRDNNHYLHNDIYISSKEVARILERENRTAFNQWKKADAMLISGSVFTGIAGGLAIGGLISLISRDNMICLGIECGAIASLGIGLGLTLGASAQYNKAIDLYNSKYDQAAVQLRWSISPNGVGLALAF